MRACHASVCVLKLSIKLFSAECICFLSVTLFLFIIFHCRHFHNRKCGCFFPHDPQVCSMTTVICREPSAVGYRMASRTSSPTCRMATGSTTRVSAGWPSTSRRGRPWRRRSWAWTGRSAMRTSNSLTEPRESACRGICRLMLINWIHIFCQKILARLYFFHRGYSNWMPWLFCNFPRRNQRVQFLTDSTKCWKEKLKITCKWIPRECFIMLSDQITNISPSLFRKFQTK